MTAKFSIVPASALFDKRLTPQQLRTLAILSYYGGSKSQGCWPSYTTLAHDIGIGRRAVISYIKHLSVCGYVVKQPRQRKDGGNTSNTYKVNLDFEVEIAEKETVDIDCKPHGYKDQNHRTPSVAGEHQPSTSGSAPGSVAGEHQHVLNNKTEQEKNNKNKKPDNKITLAQWEESKGSRLCVAMMANWIKDARANPAIVAPLIEEFREKVEAGGKVYADFAAAFKVWLRNGWLSKPLMEVRQAPQRVASADVQELPKGGLM